MNQSKTKVWLAASRPKTLWAAVSPVLMGMALAYADGQFHLLSALAALAGAVLIQIGTNYANDYFDFVKGADTRERIGPVRATQAGLVRPESMRNAFIAVFALAMLLGIYLVWRGGWPVVAIGLVSIALGVLYTATPFALAYTGLADLFVLIFFGPVAVAGTYYVQALTLSWPALLAGLAPGLISVALLTVNNLRDIDQDRQAGKMTLAVRFGRGFARAEYALALLIACLLPTLLFIATGEHAFAQVVLVLLLPAIPAIRVVFSEQEPAKLIRVLGQTGKLQLLYGVLFSVGWLI